MKIQTLNELEKTVRTKSDLDLIAMLDDRSSFTSEALQIAENEKVRRGGRSVLEESQRNRQQELLELDEHERRIQLPLRGRILGRFWIFVSVIGFFGAIVTFDFNRIVSAIAISHAIRLMLAFFFLRGSRVAIVLFAFFLAYSGAFSIYLFILLEPDGLSYLVPSSIFFFGCALIVASCWKHAVRIRKYLNSDA